jgi:predicted ATPase
MFVGRVDERKRLAAEVRPGQVVTLTGVGGVGKTRLALETAHALAGEHPDGAWWCDLTPIDGPDGLAVAVAAMLAVNLQSEMTAIAAIVDALRGRRAVVVFDNCEHLLDGAAALIDAVVRYCPHVSVLATSREPLGVDAERVWPVRPLDPDLEGVELFLDRAVAADATFVPGEDRAVLVQLCRHVDGIPLAIELAAARVRSMAPEELLARLDDRFRLLRGGTRGGLERHRTLGATLDWSYGLLDEREQRLLDCLGVFSGAFDLAAVEQICTEDRSDTFEAIDLLASLVDKSMVVAERTPAGTRYRLLETVRHYCEAHAFDRGELEGLRHRHLQHYVAVAERGFAGWLDDYGSGRSLLDRDWDNLRAATQHALTRRATETLERLFAALSWPASYALSYEVGDWAQQAVDAGCAGPATFGTAATMAAIIGRFDEGERLARGGIAVATHPLAPATWMCWVGLMQGLSRAGWTTEADEAVKAGHQTAKEAIGDWGDGFFSAMRAFRECRNDPEAAAGHARHAEAIANAKGNVLLTVDVLHLLGVYHALNGDFTRGTDSARRALTLADSLHLPRSRDGARNTLAQLVILSDPSQLTHEVSDAITGAISERLWYDLWPTIRMLARWCGRHGQRELATVIVGHLDANHLAPARGQTLDELRSQPGADRLLEHGARLDRDELAAHILERL